jgi:predicted class III extradiol MEMO1 family dioxygenase
VELPHEGASYTFAFVTARQPEHVVTVEVIDKDVKTPIKNARILLHPHKGYVYRNRTDERGVARVNVPKGEYRLYVLKDDYKDFQTTAEVASDVTIKAELCVLEREWWEG